MQKRSKSSVKVLKSVSAVSSTLSTEQVKEKISVLRSEMSHYTLESISISILSLLLFIGAPSVFPEIINPYLPSSLKIMQALIAIPTVFWILSILGNVFRLFLISRLQKQISSK